jgi:excisionase family DNA binding protein
MATLTLDIPGQLRTMQTLLSVEDAASWLGVCAETVRRDIKAGKLPAIKMGGRWKVDPIVLADFLETRQVAARTASPETRQRLADARQERWKRQKAASN